jgi:glycogen(starch) synthase
MFSWETPPSTSGGRAAHVDGLAHALADTGHDVVVVTRRTSGTARFTETGSLRILRADVDLPWLPDRAIARIASANHAFVMAAADLGDWRADVVHAHDWEVAWAAQVLARQNDCPLITTFHGTERGRRGGHVPPGVPTDVNGIEWWLASASRRVIAISKILGRQVTSDFELDPTVVRSVPGGIDQTWWAAPQPDIDERPDENLVFAWGRIQYEKGFHVLAAAMAQLRPGHPNAHCVIAGRGSYLAELQSQIDVIGVSDLIDLPGYVSDNELRAFLHRSACVVIPSLYEPFGVIALEALAGGSPLVVAETGGLSEVVEGTDAALTFEPGNTNQLADRLDAVLRDRDLAQTLSENGRKLIEQSYSWPAIASRMMDCYLDALGET